MALLGGGVAAAGPQADSGALCIFLVNCELHHIGTANSMRALPRQAWRRRRARPYM